MNSLLARIPAPLKTHLRALAAVAAFAAFRSYTGGGDVQTVLDAAFAAAVPVLLKWIDPTEPAYGNGAP